MSSLPPNMVLIPKGGRPRRDDRNAAVYLAYHWRRELLDNSARLAEEWIVDHWKHGGLTDPAHVRATIKRARERTWLKSSYFLFNEGIKFAASEAGFAAAGDGRLDEWLRLEDIPAAFHRDACAVSAIAVPQRQGWGGGCFWIAGMLTARVLKLVQLENPIPFAKS